LYADKQDPSPAFVRRLIPDGRKGTHSLNAVIGTLRKFLMPPVKALVQKRPFRMHWPPGGPWR
jgi:hypothetical protein